MKKYYNKKLIQGGAMFVKENKGVTEIEIWTKKAPENGKVHTNSIEKIGNI